MKRLLNVRGLEGRRSKSDNGLNEMRPESSTFHHRVLESKLSLGSSTEDDDKSVCSDTVAFDCRGGVICPSVAALIHSTALAQPMIFVSSFNDNSGLPPLPVPLRPSKVDYSGEAVKKQGARQASDSAAPALDIAAAQAKRRNEAKESPRSPTKLNPPAENTNRLDQILPMMNHSRNVKFHKLFKDVPGAELCFKSYSCAFIGDILIQGYLYISSNHFCFYSRILGIEKQVKIPVAKVLNITREKTAIFIPNAIGVVTAEDKYVFGSLLTRDNAYRLMYTVWQSLSQPESGKAIAADIDISLGGDGTENNNNLSKGDANGFGESSGGESVSSVCVVCGIPVSDHASGEPCDEHGDNATDADIPQTDSPMSTGSGLTTSIHAFTIDRQVLLASQVTSTSSVTSQGTAQLPADSNPSSDTNSQHAKASVISGIVHRMQNIPKTNLMLSMCVVMVILLATCAVIMLNKIFLLQQRLDGSHTAPQLNSQGLYQNMYFLNQEYHTSSLKRFHSVMEANIQVLNQIHNSLQGLQSSIIHPQKDIHSSEFPTCAGSQDTRACQNGNT